MRHRTIVGPLQALRLLKLRTKITARSRGHTVSAAPESTINCTDCNGRQVSSQHNSNHFHSYCKNEERCSEVIVWGNFTTDLHYRTDGPRVFRSFYSKRCRLLIFGAGVVDRCDHNLLTSFRHCVRVLSLYLSKCVSSARCRSSRPSAIPIGPTSRALPCRSRSTSCFG